MKKIVYLSLMSGAGCVAAMGLAGGALAQSAPPVATQPAASSAGTGVGATSSSAAAAASSGDGVQDIIVTAQRKTENLQNVPIAVNVVSGAQITQRGISLSNDLPALVPGLTFAATGGAGTAFLRGVGSNAGNPNDEASVATYVDGVYIASPYANVMNLNNIDRVEVLKGPQGTLFGRNATGGVIQIITRDPQQTPEFEATAGYGNYDTISGSIYGTTGLAPNLAIDIAAQGSKQNHGWGRNLTLNEDAFKTKDWSVRSKIKFEPSPDFKMVLAGDYQYLNSNTAAYRLPAGALGIDGVPSPSGGYDVRGDVTLFGLGEPRVISKQHGVSLTNTADVGFARLVTISAYRKNTGYYAADADASPLPFVEAKLPILQENFSQEVQLMSKTGGWIDWTVGGYYYHNNAGYNNYTFAGLAFGTPPGASYGEILSKAMQRTESYSGYAQATAEVVDGLKLTGGIRYTDEKLRSKTTVFGAPIPNQHAGYKKPTWRVSADYAFTSDIHAYVSYNRGVKGGGFDLLSPGTQGFNPERLDAYEVGVKSKLFNNMLRFNVSGFWYDYKNIQVQVIPAGASGGIIQTTNAAKARIKGIDADFEFVPVHNLSIAGGAAYIDGKYLDFNNTVAYTTSPLDPRQSFCSPAVLTSCIIDASGNRTVRTPKFTGNLTVSYKVETDFGNIVPSVTASHNSGFFFSADNQLKQPSYTLVNASLGWTSQSGQFGVTAWVNNLTKEYYLNQGVPSSLGALTSPAAPRTFGGTLKVKFGG